MLQAQLDRVDAGGVRQLVHEALDREGIQEPADRPQGAGAHRQPLQRVQHDPLIGEIVDRHRVALAGRLNSRQCVDAGRLRERLVQVPRRQQGRAFLQPGPRDVRIAPELMAPVDDASGVIDRAVHGDDHRRPERRPGQFVLVRPLQPHGVAFHGAGEQHRVERRVVGRVVTVASGALHMANGDRVGRDAERLRDVQPGRVDRLALAPHLDCAGLHPRHRAGRPDRRVGQERP